MTMNFKSKMKKTEQEDALLEANANLVMPESSEEHSEDCSIVMNSDNMKMVADFIKRVDVLTNPNFKIRAEYVPSEEFKSVIASFSQSAKGLAGEMKKYYDSIPEKVFDKVRSQIMEDVKRSQSNQRTELWGWRIFGWYSIFGWVCLVLWWMCQNSIIGNNTMAISACVAVVLGLLILAYKMGGWMKND